MELPDRLARAATWRLLAGAVLSAAVICMGLVADADHPPEVSVPSRQTITLHG